MRWPNFFWPALLAAAGLAGYADAKKPSNAVLLSKIESLTVRSDRKTSHRRVSAIPQLKCVGGNGRGHYEVDVMRCKNAGASYDSSEPEWTCTASLPPQFKLGSTDVICEGYDSPDDPYILKGSCGVEYRLILTELGEKKFGHYPDYDNHEEHHYEDHPGHDHIVSRLFWLAVGAVALWLLWVFIRVLMDGNTDGRGGQLPGWNGGGGGGNDPPPPYDWNPSGPKPFSSNSGSQGWRPGFFTGAATGATAGYYAGSQRSQHQGRYDRPEPSRPGPSGGGESSSNSSTARYESTGFGSTTRR